jgi:triosephosphate isomerase
MKHYTIAGNWKMHQTPAQAVSLLGKLQKQIQPHTHVTTIIAPPFVDLLAIKDQVESDKLRVAAQNLHEQDEGAFTGEVSGPMLRGLAEYVIIGHSERRNYARETDKQVAAKLAAAIRNDLKPILCVGEKLADREDGHSRRVVVDQLHADLHELTQDDVRMLTIAYEPVWAIGTGEFAKPHQVLPIVKVIRQTLEELFGKTASSKVEILYGGSANADNAQAYLELEHVNGLLVGGASLNFEQFAKIVTTAQKLSDQK